MVENEKPLSVTLFILKMTIKKLTACVIFFLTSSLMYASNTNEFPNFSA